MLVSDCDRVTILFSGKDKNEELAASGLISSISRALTHGEIITDYLDTGAYEGMINTVFPDKSQDVTGAAV